MFVLSFPRLGCRFGVSTNRTRPSPKVTSEMAWVDIAVLICFATMGSASVHFLNVHTCTYAEGMMSCPWRGDGLYTPDRELLGVHTIIMERMSSGNTLDVRQHTPNLVTVMITGDVLCKDVQTLPRVTTHVNRMGCHQEQVYILLLHVLGNVSNVFKIFRVKIV